MEPGSSNLLELQVDGLSNSYLAEAARWAKFLAIMGFIFCGLFALFGIFFGTFMSKMSSQYGSGLNAGMGAVMGFVYILCALLYFFPCLYLFRFGAEMQNALRTNDQQLLATSFRNLKSLFKFLGILTIISLSIWVLALVFGGLGAMMSGFK